MIFFTFNLLDFEYPETVLTTTVDDQSATVLIVHDPTVITVFNVLLSQQNETDAEFISNREFTDGRVVNSSFNNLIPGQRYFVYWSANIGDFEFKAPQYVGTFVVRKICFSDLLPCLVTVDFTFLCIPAPAPPTPILSTPRPRNIKVSMQPQEGIVETYMCVS